jgi:hypothetical protein
MRPLRGMSFVDVVVGSAMVLIVFITMFGLVRATTVISTVGKAKAGATAVANSQIEYIRSLAYDSVGTVGGIPSGTIAQNATTSMNGVAYNVRTFIQYEDDPADGTGASDTNSITTDYKDIKVVVTYTLQGVTRSETVISNMAPIGIETTNNGGTLAMALRTGRERVARVEAHRLVPPGEPVRELQPGGMHVRTLAVLGSVCWVRRQLAAFTRGPYQDAVQFVREFFQPSDTGRLGPPPSPGLLSAGLASLLRRGLDGFGEA